MKTSRALFSLRSSVVVIGISLSSLASAFAQSADPGALPNAAQQAGQSPGAGTQAATRPAAGMTMTPAAATTPAGIPLTKTRDTTTKFKTATGDPNQPRIRPNMFGGDPKALTATPKNTGTNVVPVRKITQEERHFRQQRSNDNRDPRVQPVKSKTPQP